MEGDGPSRDVTRLVNLSDAVVPAVGMWSLLLLFISPVVIRLLSRNRPAPA